MNQPTTIHFRFCFYLLTVFYFSHGVSYPENIVIETEYGKIEGLRMENNINDLAILTPIYDRFYGIPYAQPPVDELRFEPPQPLKKWANVLETKKKKPSCPQEIYPRERFYLEQSEDCLYLNIFSPYEVNNPNKRYPLFFYIHGGSYEGGSGHVFNGKILASLGVMVVTINYRLGALGFLTSGDDILPGNYGLQDIIMALSWVKRNIGQFRGDSDRVTLIGQSVGASLVGLLMTLPITKGLFWAVISHSGSCVAAQYSCYTENHHDYHAYLRQVAILYKCNETVDIAKIKSCLKKTPTQKFLEARQNSEVCLAPI